MFSLPTSHPFEISQTTACWRTSLDVPECPPRISTNRGQPEQAQKEPLVTSEVKKHDVSSAYSQYRYALRPPIVRPFLFFSIAKLPSRDTAVHNRLHTMTPCDSQAS